MIRHGCKWALALVLAHGGAIFAQAKPDPDRAAIAAKIEPVLANPPASGLLIFAVEPGSQAAKAGFQPGDILTVYDSQPVLTTSQLLQLARKAGAEGRKRMPAIAQRGQEMIDAEFDLAPLGLRMVPVKQGDRRTLWRPETPYKPDLRPLSRLLSKPHRYEIQTIGSKTIGWSHTYVTRATGPAGERFVVRTQSRIDSAVPGEDPSGEKTRLSERRDVVVGFRPGPYLLVDAVWIQVNDKVALEATLAPDGQLVGSRVGVPVSAPLPDDAVSSHLAGLVCCTMPMKAEACLRSSYLDPFSLVAAPFADLLCTGLDNLENSAGQKLSAYRFEQTVFGEIVGEYWIDANREVVQCQFPNGVRSTRTTKEEVQKRFGDIDNVFGKIENLPQINAAGLKAN